MPRLAAALLVLALAGACGRPAVSRRRRRDHDAACTDRSKPLAYEFPVATDAFRSGCYDVRVRPPVDPHHPDDQLLDRVVYCCPR